MTLTTPSGSQAAFRLSQHCGNYEQVIEQSGNSKKHQSKIGEEVVV